MATEFFFNGRVIRQPGAYSTIVAGQRNAPLNLDYGRVLVIDTGVEGATYGGGSGINGQLATGKDAIYRFDNIEDYQMFLKGGLLYQVAEGLFRPDVNTAAVGASEVLHAKAATTTAATMTFTATGGGSNGGTFAFRPRDEGRIANGELNETRAQSTLTIMNPGATGDVITIAVGGTTIASYTNASSDTTPIVIAGLVNDFSSRGLSNVISTTGTTIVFTEVANQGASTRTPTITVTGGAAATALVFSGGVVGTELSRGYAFQIETGVVDTSKWIMKIYVGTFTGLHTDGVAYNEVSAANAEPRLLTESPEFNNMQTLIDWGNTNPQFGASFMPLSTNAIAGDGSVAISDVTALTGYQFATGGTEVYSSTRLAEILTAMQDELYSFILVDLYGITNYTDAQITQIITHINNDSRYERFLFIGGGQNETEFGLSGGSLGIATSFDNDLVHVVHGQVGTASQSVSSGFRIWPSLVHTAYVVGRTAGRPPQVPVTNKTLGVDMLTHNLTDRQKDQALDAGLIVSFFNQFLNRIVVLQGINTLQDNQVLFNNRGQSFQISFRRVIAQVNMELVVNAETSLLSDEGGVNTNTLSAGMIKNFTETYLESRLAVPDLDNLLLNYRDVVVTRQADAWLVNYALVINNEINKLFFTGFLFS